MPRARVKPHWAADIKRVGEYRNQLEANVAAQLTAQGHGFGYEEVKYSYITKHTYITDFCVGDVLIEVKGYWPAEQRMKLLHVFKSHPMLRLFVALERPDTRISKTSKITYAGWCSRYLIPWCPIPIPPRFLQEWLEGKRTTF